MFNRAIVAMLPLVPKPLVWRISRRYIAGTRLRDALETVRALNRSGMSGTLDLLGEDTTEPDQARRSSSVYHRAISRIAEEGLDCNISIKLSQLGLRFDAGLCREILGELVADAERQGNFVRIDMEDSSVTEQTLDIYRDLRRTSPAVGAVVQAALHRTPRDVAELLADGSTHLRLCKGIYLEPEEVAIQERERIREAFRGLLRQIVEGGAVKVGIATHDRALIDDALHFIEERQLPADRYEFQMLLGVTERIRAELVGAGHPLRVYVPFGEEWYAYSTRRLRENPQIAGHVVRNLFVTG